MLYQEQLAQKIQTLPPSLLPMVDVFVEFLLTRYSIQPENDDLYPNQNENRIFCRGVPLRAPARGRPYKKSASQVDLSIDATELARIAMLGGAFDWLNDPAEDGIYGDEDGEPV